MNGHRRSAAGHGAHVENALLRRVIAAISTELDPDAVVRRVAGLITEITGTDVCFVHLVDDTGRRLVLSGATPPFDKLAGTIELAVGEGVAGWVALHATPAVILENKRGDPRYKYIPELQGDEFVSLISVPMLARNRRLVGVVNVHSRTRREFSPDDVRILVDLANLMAGAIDNARLYQQLAEREKTLAEFAEHTLELQENERRRLAAEVHDGISQRIVSLHYHLCAADDALGGAASPVAEQLHTARQLARAALDEARGVIRGLRPPLLDDLGLGPCLADLARTLTGAMDVDVEVDDDCDLDDHVETALYRIAQEAVQNVAKHARASRVRLELRCEPSETTLVVSDDGVGFDPGTLHQDDSSTSFGLIGMRARADLIGADLQVTSHPGRGTVVAVAVRGPGAGSPLEAAPSPATAG